MLAKAAPIKMNSIVEWLKYATDQQSSGKVARATKPGFLHDLVFNLMRLERPRKLGIISS